MHFVPDDHRVVLAYHLPEVAGRGQMVVQSAVGHEEYLLARNFTVDDAANIDSCFPDQIAAELDDQPRLGQRAASAVDEIAQIAAYRPKIERLFARKVGNAKAATDIQREDWSRGRRRQGNGKLDRFLLRFADRRRLQVLRAAVDM